jgi:hypothetical protein
MRRFGPTFRIDGVLVTLGLDLGLVLFWKRLEHGAFRWPPICESPDLPSTSKRSMRLVTAVRAERDANRRTRSGAVANRLSAASPAPVTACAIWPASGEARSRATAFGARRFRAGQRATLTRAIADKAPARRLLKGWQIFGIGDSGNYSLLTILQRKALQAVSASLGSSVIAH